jgi:hypothetical protein
VETDTRCTAFEGSTRLASGDLVKVALAAKAATDRGPTGPVLIFDDATARVLDLDLRGSAEDVRMRLAAAAAPPPAPRGPGRPKLGVVAREVTLLPRHWDWLSAQPGGASVALRRLVEDARRADDGPARKRLAQEAAYRFMSAMAGNEAGYEEATRALFAADRPRFDAETAAWPADVRDYARLMASDAFEPA